MRDTSARGGLIFGFISGAVAGTLFGLFVQAVDTNFGKDIVRGVDLAAKQNRNPHFPIFPDPKGTAASAVGFFLGMLTTWGVRKAVRCGNKVATTSPSKEGLIGLLLGDFAQTLFLAVLAAVCATLGLGLLDAVSPPAVVALAAAVAGIIFGGYGAFCGWGVARQTASGGDCSRSNEPLQPTGPAGAAFEQDSGPQGILQGPPKQGGK
jgi:hypothetical protein